MFRTRKFDERYSSEPATVETFRGGPPPYSVGLTTLQQNHHGLWTQVDDVTTSNFYSRLKAGEIIMNGFGLHKISQQPCEIDFIAGPWSSWYNGGYEHYAGDFAGYLRSGHPFIMPIGIPIDNLASAALAKATAKVQECDVMVGEAINDLDQSVAMLKSPFKDSIELLKKIKARKMKYLSKSAWSVTKAAKNAWLEYRYGWKPLIGDVEKIIDGAAAIRAKKFSHSNRLVARSGHKVEAQRSDSFDATIYGPMRFIGSVLSSYKARADAGVMYAVVPQTSGEELAKLLGTRACDLPATIWEIIPYSFVVDWFVNVGNWIQAVTPNPYISVKGNWVTTCQTKTATYSSGEIKYVWNGTFTGDYPGFVDNDDLVVRSVNQPLSSTPVLSATSLNVLHSVDALSLSIGKINSLLRDVRH